MTARKWSLKTSKNKQKQTKNPPPSHPPAKKQIKPQPTKGKKPLPLQNKQTK